SEPDVIEHRLPTGGEHLLKDGLDTEGARFARAVQRDLPTGDRHGAVVRPVYTPDDLHERALAGSVLAEERVYFALSQLDIGIDEGARRAETLADIDQAEGARLLLFHAT